MRALGLSQGEIVPSTLDAQGRKGIVLPARLRDGFDFFETVRASEKPDGFGYAKAFGHHWSGRVCRASHDRDPSAIFVRYEGSESYSPDAYLLHAATAAAAEV